MNPQERLKEMFGRFPGIGPKQASRFVYFLLKESASYKQELSRHIDVLKDSSETCVDCLRIFWKGHFNTDTKVCNICSDANRDDTHLMIVVKDLDVEAIERSQIYAGKYFLLGNTLPFLTERPSDVINVRELVSLISRKIKKDVKEKDLEKENVEEDAQEEIDKDTLREIIFALPATDEGDNTVEYLKKTLSQVVGIQDIKFSTLARGISTGLDIEYVDKQTFKEAFMHRD